MTQSLHFLDSLLEDIGLTEKEIRQRKEFLQLSSQQEAFLQEIDKEMAPIWHELVSSFYDHLLTFETPKNKITTHTTVDKLQDAQEIYFSQLSNGTYDKDYIKNRIKVGLIHQKIGVEPKWYIGAYSFYIIRLVPHIMRLCEGSNDKFVETFSSLLKVIMLDISLALDTYFHTDKKVIEILNNRLVDHLSSYSDKIINQLPAGILALNSHGKVISSNFSMSQMLDLKEIPGGILFSDLPLPLKVKKNMVFPFTLEKAISFNQIRHKVKNKVFYFDASILPLPISDEPCALLILQDVSEKVKYEEELGKLTHSSMHDPLTKLANRTFLYEWFKERKNSQKTQQFAVLFIDLDGFKKINDTFGHYIGDLFLEVIARRLEASVKKNDLVIRLGGDEFCIILNKMGNQRALLPVIQRLQDNLFTPLNVENITIYPKASIGVSIYPEDGQDILTLIKKADTAMYKAKGKGGGTYQLTQPSL